MQRWPGALLLAAGLWSLRYGLEPVALATVAVGFWGVAEFWRGARVTGGVLVARGRVSWRTLPLAEVRQVGHTSTGTAWVRPAAAGRSCSRWPRPGSTSPGPDAEIAAALREQAEQAGADLEPAPEAADRPAPTGHAVLRLVSALRSSGRTRSGPATPSG